MAIVLPITSPIAVPITSGVGAESFAAGLSSFSAAKLTIQQGAADVNILVVGDSTGNQTDEWVYLFGQWLESEYPTHAVSYSPWNDAGNVYDAPISLGTGTGPRTIHIWNASVSGAPAQYFTGSKQPAAIDAVSADLIIFNMGHNNVVGQIATLERGEFLQGIEHARLSKPSAYVATFLQNPNRDDNEMASGVAEMAAVAGLYGDVRVVDAYNPFIAQGKASSLYIDNVHPSASGTQLFLAAIQGMWRGSSISSGLTSVGALLSETSTNLLSNADFADVSYVGGTPSGWTAIASPTCTVETTIKDAGAAQSMKIVGTSAGSRISQTLSGGSLSALQGNKATLAVRVHVPTGSVASVGRVDLRYTDGATTIVTTRSATVAQGAFKWLIIPGLDIPNTASSVAVNLYCDTAANASSAAYYDRAVLVVGDKPRDAA